MFDRILNTPLMINVVRCAIWYHLYNLKNVKSTHGEVLIFVKLQAEASMGVFYVFKLYKWYQIAQHITNVWQGPKYTSNFHDNFKARKLLMNKLTHLFPMDPFSAPWKHKKILWFSDVFQGDGERVHWEQMG